MTTTAPPAAYLDTLLNATLHITTTDTRMFVGEFKCTDNCNIILSSAYEHRPPSAAAVRAAAAAAGGEAETLALPMTSRFMGLIVVPGKYVEKIEVES